MGTSTYTKGAILTVRRPDGRIEDVVNTQQARNGVIPAAVFAQMVAATKQAGRGDIISQRPNVVAVSLDVQRMALSGQLDDLANAFPGSSQWTAARKIESELAAFDQDHPEVIAKIIADRKDRTAEGVARALRLED
jgi:hypothetical protein